MAQSKDNIMTTNDPAMRKGNNGGLIIFDVNLLKRLQTTDRLPGTYIGVRRVRPSSREVHRAHVGHLDSTSNHNSSMAHVIQRDRTIAFKVVDPVTGQERRMTAQEKKAAKIEHRRLLIEARKEARANHRGTTPESTTTTSAVASSTNASVGDTDTTDATCLVPSETNEVQATQGESLLQSNIAQATESGTKQNSSHDDERYYYFKMNPAALEQELADLRGDRNAVPPVLLSFFQAHAARMYHVLPSTTLLETGTNPNNSNDNRNQSQSMVEIDDVYAQQWAEALRTSMMPAIETRKAEDMRAMVYDIVPRVWNRLRPTFLDSSSLLVAVDDQRSPSDQASSTINGVAASDAILPCTLRPALPDEDHDWQILTQFLYRGQNMHIGCGVKFGCDVLLYDGPRSERHSFAGLRLVRATTENNTSNNNNNNVVFPLPRAYDLAGYVRCLNTAGKLALLATVVPSTQGTHRVAILDLALEKIDLQRKPKPIKSLEQRKQNLLKTKG